MLSHNNTYTDNTYIHTYIHTYIYIYIYTCACMYYQWIRY